MKRYGLVGYPLGHSFSKVFFDELFGRLGVEASYENFELIDAQAVGRLIRSGLEPGGAQIDGLSVTIPYKREVMEMVDSLDAQAQAVGAVNCIAFRDGSSIGYNTDVIGFGESLAEFLGGVVVERALILGSGGAALAVRYVLEAMGIEYAFVSRGGGRQQQGLPLGLPLGQAQKQDMGQGRSFGYDELKGSVIENHKLIINATPLGMWPNTEQAPEIPFDQLDQNHYLYDLVYNPRITKFMAQGLCQGAHVTGGLRMLELQALAAWKIWNN